MSVERKDFLLGAVDPPPVRITNPDGRSSFLLLGDHAGHDVPASLNGLGLGEADRARHIAQDIGIAGLGRMLAERLDACFIEQVYSRLVVDCNRAENHAEVVMAISDGTIVPANEGLDETRREARLTAVHRPYHAAITERLGMRDAAGMTTILLALHSFTPVMAGQARPWDVGVLHDGGDTGFALALLERLRSRSDLTVGDNAPYRMDDTDFTIAHHGYAARRPYAEIEIRQDHLADADGQERWADIMAEMVQAALD